MNRAFLRHAAQFSAALLATTAAILQAAPVENAAKTAGAAEQATDAMKSGIPEVAIVKLREALAGTPELKEPGEKAEEARAGLRLRLAEALLAAGNAEEALTELKEVKELNEPKEDAPSQAPPTAPSAPDGLSAPALKRRQTARLLKARANFALGRWEEALALFRAAWETPEAPQTAVLGMAESLRALGRLDEAIAALEATPQKDAPANLRLAELYLEDGRVKPCARLLPEITASTPGEEKWKQYVEARLLLAQGHPAYSLGRFESLQNEPGSPGLTLGIMTGALLGVSDSRAQLSGLASADNVLEQFIWRHPESPRLGELFSKLDEIYAGEEDASDSELQKWAERGPEHRAGFAAFYLARLNQRAGKRERALKALEKYDDRFPQHPVLAAALLLRGQLLTAENRYSEAQATLNAAMRASKNDLERAEIEMASAAISFQQGEFVLAATVFRAAGEHAPALWERAMFNSALSWLHQGNFPRFLQDYQELSARVPKSPYRRELILEEGLLQARQGPSQAAAAQETLRRFIEDFGDNPRVTEARIALAELRLSGNDPAGASEILRVSNEVAAENPPSAQTPQAAQALQQSAYLAIFVADAAEPRDDAKVAALCEEFLAKFPLAAKRPEVRMKLGQVCFRTGDFVGAQTQFETLARETPSSPLVETALFLAGQASMKRMSEGAIDRAIELFEETAKMDGPLKLQARLQQAVAHNRLAKQNEAILLYDAILRADPPADVRFAALAGKAANLAELGERDRALYEQALELYSRLAAEPGLGVTWRGQALCEKGRLLEILGKPGEALAAYYDVLAAGLAQPEEYYWFYKAGFDAGRLCEAQGQWKSAIGVYRKMAALKGPRAEEAEKLADRLRLEHFIWE